jgi:hypothetical protein
MKEEEEEEEEKSIPISIWILLLGLFLIFFFPTFNSLDNEDKRFIIIVFGLVIGVVFVFFFLPKLKKYLENTDTSSTINGERILTEDEILSDDSRYIPSEVKRTVWKRDGGRCVNCGSKRDLEYDHDIPFSRGGSNTENNIRILCKRCNREKSAKIK